MSAAATTTTTPAVNGTAAPADAAAPAAPVAAAEPTKKRPGRKPGSKNKSKAASATPAVAGTAPKRRYTKKSKSVCLAPGKVACKKRVTSHGLCTTHWSTARLMIERGLTTLADLISAGVALDKHVTPSRKAFLDAVKASQASSPPVATPVAAPVVSHVVPVNPIVTN